MNNGAFDFQCSSMTSSESKIENDRHLSCKMKIDFHPSIAPILKIINGD